MALIWYLGQIRYLLCGAPISLRLLKQEVMSQYLAQTCSDYFSSKSHYLVYVGALSRSQANTMIDKQIEHAVDYFSSLPQQKWLLI